MKHYIRSFLIKRKECQIRDLSVYTSSDHACRSQNNSFKLSLFLKDYKFEFHICILFTSFYCVDYIQYHVLCNTYKFNIKKSLISIFYHQVPIYDVNNRINTFDENIQFTLAHSFVNERIIGRKGKQASSNKDHIPLFRHLILDACFFLVEVVHTIQFSSKIQCLEDK